MALSKLQKYILKKGWESNRDREVSKKALIDFYKKQKKAPKLDDQIGIITKSVERLIGQGMVRGFGIKTKKKWFVSKVGLTRGGIKKARELFGQQQSLPFKNKRKKYVRRNKRK